MPFDDKIRNIDQNKWATCNERALASAFDQSSSQPIDGSASPSRNSPSARNKTTGRLREKLYPSNDHPPSNIRKSQE